MIRFRIASSLVALVALPLAAQSVATVQTVIPAQAGAAQTSALRESALRAHTKFLSSDALEGRGPGTRGDALTVAYISSQFEAAGLEPAGDGGTFLQKVPLIGVTTVPEKTTVSLVKDGAPTIGPLKYLDEFVGQNHMQTNAVSVDSELVFVGHGVVAPEYKWDDYRGLDTRGKTLVMLVDDPPATAKEPELFKGIARTYYGRWTYKYEIGAVKNAAGVILIHTDKSAGYGWSVVRNSWSGEQSYMKNAEGQHALQFAGWLTRDVAEKLFKAAGQDLTKLMAAAGTRNFKPVSLGYRLKADVASDVRPFDTWNVIAKLPGSDAKLRDEAVFYTAHHDHIGIGKADETGDAIYNGAIDNATGIAMILELGRAWANAPARPKRSLYFAAVAAEEQGLLGSQWLAANPPVPAGRIALAINYDGIGLYGRVKDVQLVGAERTTFYPTIERVAKAHSLRLVPDAHPEQGYYYRSDHFSMAKFGVPAFSVNEGNEMLDKPADTATKWEAEYRAKRYHQPADEYDPSFDFSTAVQIGEFGIALGTEAANADTLPTWNVGDEFRAARDRSMSVAK
jgi:Zn-dependent M28 family amino/carboxypeptidase